MLIDNRIDLICWLDAEAFKRLPHHSEEKREAKAKDFKIKYLQKKYFFGTSSPASKQEQNEVFTRIHLKDQNYFLHQQAVMSSGGWGKTLKDRPPTDLILQVQKYARRRLQDKWIPLFLASDDYKVESDFDGRILIFIFYRIVKNLSLGCQKLLKMFFCKKRRREESHGE